jgi:hypothetical protein
MTDLEKMIRERQDALRGRPADSIDRFMDWYASLDWFNIAMFVLAVAGTLAGAMLMVTL